MAPRETGGAVRRERGVLEVSMVPGACWSLLQRQKKNNKINLEGELDLWDQCAIHAYSI